MIQVLADQTKGILTLRFQEHVSGKDLQDGLEELKRGLSNMPPEFRLLTDLSKLEAMEYSCVPYIETVMDLCYQKGAREGIRIIPDPHKDPGLNIMSYFHYHGQVRITTCSSPEEAEQLLQG